MMDHEQIRKLRADLGISQAELARAAGINRTILSGFETGQLALKGDCARRLEDFFQSRGASVTVRPPRPDPAILDELRWVEACIARIEAADYNKGLVDSFFEQGEKERQELFPLLARWRVLKQALQGKARADAPVPRKPVTQADYMAREYLKLLNKAANGAH